MAEDVGWAGVWKPMVVDEKTAEELKDLAGTPVYNKKSGAPYEWAVVNLRTGEFRYPISWRGIAPD